MSNLEIIYTPKGRAREYSPLALNIFKGCDHGCVYCYIPKIYKVSRKHYADSVKTKQGFLQKIERDAKKLKCCEQQVLLSFAGDPYNKTEQDLKSTRQALQILLKYNIPVSILTKGGQRCLRDLDIFKLFEDHIKVGASLTFINDNQSKRFEPGAALPADRLQALRILHDNNVKTWVSFEPVINPLQTLELLNSSLDFVNEYRIGKINYDKDLESKIQWPQFLDQALKTLRKEKKQIYIKQDLRKACKEIRLYYNEMDMDLYLANPFFFLKNDQPLLIN